MREGPLCSFPRTVTLLIVFFNDSDSLHAKLKSKAISTTRWHILVCDFFFFLITHNLFNYRNRKNQEIASQMRFWQPWELEPGLVSSSIKLRPCLLTGSSSCLPILTPAFPWPRISFWHLIHTTPTKRTRQNCLSVSFQRCHPLRPNSSKLWQQTRAISSLCPADLKQSERSPNKNRSSVADARSTGLFSLEIYRGVFTRSLGSHRADSRLCNTWWPLSTKQLELFYMEEESSPRSRLEIAWHPPIWSEPKVWKWTFLPDRGSGN